MKKILKNIQNGFRNLKNLNLQKKFNLMKYERQVIFIVAIIAALVINLLLSAVALRVDFSKGSAYTLSKSTKNIVKKLNDVVTIKFFVSSDIPSRLVPLKTEVTDLLNEYKKQNSKIDVKTEDPKKDTKAQNEAKQLGIPELQFSQMEQDKYNVTASTFGIAVQYGGKTELIPQATDTQTLEYAITAAIYKLTQKNLAKVGIIGQQSAQLTQNSDPIATLRQVLQQQFTVQDLDISSSSATPNIDSSVKTVLVFDDNQKTYSDSEINSLQKYIDNKGTAVFFTDGVWVPSDLNGDPTEAKHNLFGLLRNYGLELQKDLVLSTSYELVNFGNDVVSFVSPYPYWVRTNDLNEKVASFGNITHLTFPWTSSVKLGKKSGWDINEVVKTSSQSWEQTKNFTLFPQNIQEPKQSDFKSFTLVAQSINKNGGGVVVIPTSRFVNEDFAKRNNDNLEFVLDMVNNLASNGALSGIRQRAVDFYQLPALQQSQKDMAKYGTMLLLPVIFGLYGAWRLMKRK